MMVTQANAEQVRGSAGTTLPAARVTDVQVRAVLQAVPDPELPFMTLADFGVLRDVEMECSTDDKRVIAATITITPKYTGCPAAAMMCADVDAALRRIGVATIRVKLQLAPSWTTDWITPTGREKLVKNGYSAPGYVRRNSSVSIPLTLDAPPSALCCPHCESGATHKISEFGSCPCKAMYACSACGEPFEHFKEF